MMKTERKSSIEILKIIAMLAIVLSHVCQTLGTMDNEYVNFHDYVIPLEMATTDIQLLALAILRYGGAFGNTVFFVCSCWFLLDSNKASVKKIVFMLADIWVVSVIILIVACAAMNGAVNGKLIIKSLFPTFFANNWYLTCYMLFYVLHPFLNKIIHGLNQRQLLRVSVVLAFLYIFCNFIMGCFEASHLTLWIAIYFCVAYMKIYLRDFMSNKRINLCLAFGGIIGNIAIVLLTDFLGIHNLFFQDKLLYWAKNANPFLVVLAICLFNLMNRSSYKSKMVNRISSLSLLIYIIHENILVRTYFRPFLFKRIQEIFGYDYIILWVLLMSFFIFVTSAIVSMLYKAIIQKFVKRLSNRFYLRICEIYIKFEELLLKVE